jgi:hypothetical protein
MATLVNLSADETDVILSECDNVVCLSQFGQSCGSTRTACCSCVFASYDSKFVSVDQGLAKLSNLCSLVLFTMTKKNLQNLHEHLPSSIIISGHPWLFHAFWEQMALTFHAYVDK